MKSISATNLTLLASIVSTAIHAVLAVGPAIEPRPQAVACLRGGDLYQPKLCVDNEGNFFTPQGAAHRPEAASTTPATPPTAFSATPAESLRGGSRNSNQHNFGGLSVDSDGNLFAAPLTATSSTASLCGIRGGALEVDNEGNFYTPRQVLFEQRPKLGYQGSRRLPRKDNCEKGDAVVLTDRRLHKKNVKAKTQKPWIGTDDPMAFIGYNNALMET